MAVIDLPTNPSVSNAEVGKDFLVYINTGTAQAPDWSIVGGQRGGTLNRTAEEIDVSHKTSGGWSAKRAGLRGWSIDLDSLVVMGDTGATAAEQAFNEGKEINVKFEYPDGSYRTGWGSITDMSIDAPHDGEASLSCTISGNGAISDLIKDKEGAAV